MPPRLRRSAWTMLFATIALSAAALRASAGDDPGFGFNRPMLDQLSLAGEVQVEIRVPNDAVPGTLVVQFDHIPVTDQLTAGEGIFSGAINGVGAGQHVLEAMVQVNRDGDDTLADQVRFE